MVLASDRQVAIDSWMAWLAGRASPARADPDPGPMRPLTGSARVVATLGGSLDSLGVEIRASLDRVAWHGWQLPAGRARFEWHPGGGGESTPTFSPEATLDSLAYGTLGFSGAAAAGRGTLDWPTWFARSGDGGGRTILAGGRLARA